MLPAHARLATLAPMSKRTTETASGAVLEIEPELRELFTKVVERDPREAVKMLQPYPDEFVVKMLELLNPAQHSRSCNASIYPGARRFWPLLIPKPRSSGCAIKLIRSAPLGG